MQTFLVLSDHLLLMPFLLFCLQKKKKCLLTNRYIWQQWAITHYAPGAVLGARKLTWKVSEASSDSQEFVLLPSAYMTKWPQVFSSCCSFAVRESSSQTSCTLLTGWFQSDSICSKVETFISYIPSACLLNLPRRSASQCTLMQKWSSRCLQPGGPHGGTIIFSYRPSIKAVCRCACSRLLYLRCVHKTFQGPPSTVISQVDQYRDHLTLEA